MVPGKILQQFFFWSVWLVIPLLWEIVVGFLSAVVLVFKRFGSKPRKLDFCPDVAILIPAYNSELTIKKCLDSILTQNYPLDKIEVFIIGNGSKDGSYDIFNKFHYENNGMNIWWHHSPKGKSKALNKGIFGSKSKYIINIDSDGWLDSNAVRNIIAKFEGDEDISCMTGVIMIDPELIEKTESRFKKILRKCEFFEYMEAFLVGRNFHSMTNSMFTMSGAFSCFRKEALAKTQMYNFETIGEDTHMTFQIRSFAGGKVVMCEDAFFYVDPIESFNKLYIQRQRWQRGQLEVASLFKRFNMGGIIDFFRKFSFRIIVSDHTLAFPRLIWFFAVVYLYFVNYPLRLLIGANVLMYLIYALNSIIYLFVSSLYLRGQKSARKYALGNWHICFIMPVYRLIAYFIRMAGIMNSLATSSKWSAPTLSEEVDKIKAAISDELKAKLPFVYKLKKIINN